MTDFKRLSWGAPPVSREDALRSALAEKFRSSRKVDSEVAEKLDKGS